MRSRKGVRAAFALMAMAASWRLMAPSFVGQSLGGQGASAQPRTQVQGWRLDRSFENFLKGKNRGELETIEGFFYGETFWADFMNKQGLRYYMNPTKDEYKAARESGYNENEFWRLELGPFKIPLGRCFGCTGNNAKLLDIKRELAAKPLEPEKIAENEKWMKLYGHKRHEKKYTDLSTGYKDGVRGLPADWETGWKKGKLQGYVGEAPLSQTAIEVASKKKAAKGGQR